MPRRAPTLPPSPETVAEALIERLRVAERPLPLSTLGTMVRKQGLKVTNEALGPVLEGLATQGRAHEHPVSRKATNASRCFWYAPADTYVDALLARAIAPGGEWTDSQLRKTVPKAYHDLVDEAVGRLITGGKLFASVKRGATRRWQTSPPRVTEGLTAAQHQSLGTILQRVNALRRPALTITELLSFLDGDVPSRPMTVGGDVKTATESLTPEALMAFYAADLSRREGLRSMPIPWTWRRYVEASERHGDTPDRARFHRLLQELAASGRIALGRHDAPSRLSEEELAVVERTADGGVLYYWTPIERQP